MDRIVKVSIIGCGGIATGKHLPSLSKIPNVRLVAFCDIIPERAEAANWIKSIVDDTAPVVLPEQALVVSEILEAIYESSKTGKPVYFN